MTFVEVMFTLAVFATLSAIALPSGLRMSDDYRVGSAARFLAHRLAHARLDAIRRSTYVGVRFEPDAGDYVFATVVDGNGNGVRTMEISRGIDLLGGPPERLGSTFPGVAFGMLPGVPDADGAVVDTPDGVRVGAAGILSMNPNGSSSSGTLYVHGRERSQYAVRVLGATGRIRVLKFNEALQRWVDL